MREPADEGGVEHTRLGRHAAGRVKTFRQAVGVGAQQVLERDRDPAQLAGRQAEQRAGAQRQEVDLHRTRAALMANDPKRLPSIDQPV